MPEMCIIKKRMFMHCGQISGVWTNVTNQFRNSFFDFGKVHGKSKSNMCKFDKKQGRNFV